MLLFRFAVVPWVIFLFTLFAGEAVLHRCRRAFVLLSLVLVTSMGVDYGPLGVEGQMLISIGLGAALIAVYYYERYYESEPKTS